MRLGIDLDGVLADLAGALRREAHRLFPAAASMPLLHEHGAAEGDPRDAPGRDGAPAVLRAATPLALSAPQQDVLWREIRRMPNFWETLDEIEPGAVRRLAALARERRWDVVFLTSRPATAGDAVQVQTQRWLERCGYALPSALVANGSRGRIADALDLDLVVDDRPENCLDVVSVSPARAILVWPREGDAVPASARSVQIGVVTGMNACLDLLEEAARQEGSRRGLTSRLRQLLGLAETPAR